MGCRHPVHNDYLPPAYLGKKFLKEPDDMSNKVWDEDALVRWETECNGRRPWSGRPAVSPLRLESQLISVSVSGSGIDSRGISTHT